MSKFKFQTDKETEEYFNLIIAEMVKLFSITEEDAIIRVNESVRSDAVYTKNDDEFFHELPEFWARLIFYPPGTRWWKKNEGV